ncbi:60S acidic ribosomal protein P0 [Tanacetum coccineum]
MMPLRLTSSLLFCESLQKQIPAIQVLVACSESSSRPSFMLENCEIAKLAICLGRSGSGGGGECKPIGFLVMLQGKVWRNGKVGAPARVGLVAPVDVVVSPGNTGLDPSQTSFFQVLNIPTKINKGTVEIITPVELIKKGDKVGSS